MKSRKTAEQAALEIIETLRSRKHVALFAGGCVRDRLLGRQPKDFDVVTNARPDRIKELFPRARGVGAKFGVMLVRRGGQDIEVATFRSDGDYSDGRRPDQVTYGNEKEDALRRDFTINGLFFDPMENRVIDYVGGQADIEAGVIRTIGDPDQRFGEDHLRLLRAIRFSARLGFEIEPGTLDAVCRLATHLPTISPERIWMELEMILVDSSRSKGWSLLIDTGLRDRLSSEWVPDESADALGLKRLDSLQPTISDVALSVACVLRSHSASAAKIGRSLRWSNRLIDTVGWLLKSVDAVAQPDSMELADLKLLMAKDSWPELLELLRADLLAMERDFQPYESVVRRAEQIPADLIAPPPLVTGDDLRAMGLTPGPKLGRILNQLYRDQLNEVLHTREEAFSKARRLTS